ncbi:hypothetical protein EDC48_1274 [Gibbsiella quercinecans]|nr:hypothetical protein EDC48_1274 [Gibbsiella quercinecans]
MYGGQQLYRSSRTVMVMMLKTMCWMLLRMLMISV